jgi:hypothetical protein
MSSERAAGVASPSVTYFTIVDANYFIGAVAMINSLRITGNAGEIVVGDAGLAAWQRDRLAQHVSVLPLEVSGRVTPTFYKPHMGNSLGGDVIVYVDADMLVTGRLDGLVDLAAHGRICAAADLQPQRFFPAWHELFALQASLRRQTYVNAGFLALAPRHWPSLVTAWREACDRILDLAPPQFALAMDEAVNEPTAFHDQDALNALLMSAVPMEELVMLDPRQIPTSHEMADVTRVDERSLHCVLEGRDTLILHSVNSPKPWQRSGWITVGNDAYARLLPRVLLAEDVLVRMRPSELPFWLRGGLSTSALLPALHASVNGARAVSRALPESLRGRLRTLARRGF